MHSSAVERPKEPTCPNSQQLELYLAQQNGSACTVQIELGRQAAAMLQYRIHIAEQHVMATNLHIKLAEECGILAQESKELARDSKKVLLLSKDLTVDSREMSAFVVVSRSFYKSRHH